MEKEIDWSRLLSEYRIARLDEKGKGKIKKLEDELGITLIAYHRKTK